MFTISRNGWEIYFHPLFYQEYQKLRYKVAKLKRELPNDKFITHTDVKLFAALVRIIEEIILENPLAHYFVLKDNLKKFSRVKKKGLPERYRLFFKIYKEEKQIWILWLGYPRKEGDKKDCYAVFAKMVSQNQFPDTIEQLVRLCEEFEIEHQDEPPFFE